MGWYMYGCVCHSAAVSFRGVGGIVWPDDPAADAVAAGRDAAVPGEGAVGGVFGGVAEESGDNTDGVVGSAEPCSGEVHAPGRRQASC